MSALRVVAMAVLAVMCAVGLTAMPASDLQGLQVSRHIFSAQVLTLTGHIRTGAPETYRFLVLRCDASRPTSEETSIFASDFVLAYTFPGDDGPQEQRAKIEAIATAGEGWDFGSFVHGTEPQIQVSGNQVSIGLAALIENSAQEVMLRRAGTSNVVTVDLRQDQPRPYSIYVTSIGQQNVSAKLVQALVARGFAAHPAGALSNDTTGCTVKYGEGLEDEAETVRTVIKQTLGRDASLVQLDPDSDVCEYDMLVWLGR